MSNYTIDELKLMLDEKKKEEFETKYIKKEEKKKASFSKRVVTFVILLNIIFTLAILYVFLRTGSEPMTLVGAFFAFTTVELWSLSKIKRAEVKEEGNEY